MAALPRRRWAHTRATTWRRPTRSRRCSTAAPTSRPWARTLSTRPRRCSTRCRTSSSSWRTSVRTHVVVFAATPFSPLGTSRLFSGCVPTSCHSSLLFRQCQDQRLGPSSADLCGSGHACGGGGDACMGVLRLIRYPAVPLQRLEGPQRHARAAPGGPQAGRRDQRDAGPQVQLLWCVPLGRVLKVLRGRGVAANVSGVSDDCMQRECRLMSGPSFLFAWGLALLGGLRGLVSTMTKMRCCCVRRLQNVRRPGLRLPLQLRHTGDLPAGAPCLPSVLPNLSDSHFSD